MFMLKSTHEAAVKKLEELSTDRNAAFTKDRAAIILQRDEFEAKFKKAVKEVAGLTEDVAQAEKVADARARKIAELNAEIAALRPDAQKWRDRAERDRSRVRKTPKPAPKKR